MRDYVVSCGPMRDYVDQDQEKTPLICENLENSDFPCEFWPHFMHTSELECYKHNCKKNRSGVFSLFTLLTSAFTPTVRVFLRVV
ncbi:hypothetical protein Hanom_Chr04g00296491 [Helianthus anomalus]